jgi:hypothetical protein
MADAPKVKAASSLSNGISIGLGASALFLGLLMAFSLNAIYTEQTRYLTSKGIQVISSYGFNDLVFLISTGVFVSVMGAYLLVVGYLSNYSERASVAFSANDNWGNRLINGGIFGISFISASTVRDFYQHNHSDWYTLATISLLAVSLILIITGALLLKRIYLRSKNSTKV